MKDTRFHLMNLAKHEVSRPEAEEALYDGWERRRRIPDSEEGFPQYEVLGKTDEGRRLQLLVEVKAEFLWIFHGREMNGTERARYERK